MSTCACGENRLAANDTTIAQLAAAPQTSWPTLTRTLWASASGGKFARTSVRVPGKGGATNLMSLWSATMSPLRKAVDPPPDLGSRRAQSHASLHAHSKRSSSTTTARPRTLAAAPILPIGAAATILRPCSRQIVSVLDRCSRATPVSAAPLCHRRRHDVVPGRRASALLGSRP